MAFYGSIKAFINFGKLLHSPILSSPCWEVKLFMWLPIGYVDCVLKETQQAGLFVFHEGWGEGCGGGKKGVGILKGITLRASWCLWDRGGGLVVVKEIVWPTSQLRERGQWTLTMFTVKMCPTVCALTYVCMLALPPGFPLMLWIWK